MQFTIIKPDDWHLHLRDKDYLARTVTDSARCFGRAIIMPNLTPPVTTIDAAKAYRQRIIAALPRNTQFIPLMTLYLTDKTSPELIKQAIQCGFVYGCKLYPAGATTHSAAGVTQIDKIYPALEIMAENSLPLLIHGEVTEDTDIFMREAYFIDRVLVPLAQRFPSLKIVLEHISTKEAVEFVQETSSNIAATITAHHLLLNRNDMLAKGIRPHYYCKPILKAKSHQEAVMKAATSGNPAFFLGTDSAPHPQQQKESACGCAGIYTAHAAIELYAEAFDQANALDKLEGFASKHGADFYGLPYNQETITLVKQSWQVPDTLPFGKQTLVPLWAGKVLQWQLHG